MLSKFVSSNISDASRSYKHNANSGIVAGGGVGLTFPMSFRGELVYNHIFPITYKHHQPQGAAELTGAGDAILLRGYYDFLDLEVIKSFVGFGVGFARVKHDWYLKGIQAQTLGGKRTELSSGYQRNRAYNFTLGISAKIIPNLEMDFGYLYADYGKTKAFAGVPASAMSMKSHNLLLGVRYAL